MTAARFLLVTGRSVAGVSTPRWPNGSGPLIGETRTDGGWISWRLAGANNRELGRSARVYPDLPSCRTSILMLRAGVAHAQPLIAMDYVSGLWGWQLELDGVLVAVSGRSYRRERECRYNLQQFRTATGEAELLSDAPLSRPVSGWVDVADVGLDAERPQVDSSARPW